MLIIDSIYYLIFIKLFGKSKQIISLKVVETDTHDKHLRELDIQMAKRLHSIFGTEEDK